MVISPTYFLFTFIEIYSGSLRAQGHVLISTIMTMTGVCLLRIVWTTCIVPNGTLEQIIACYPITWVVTGSVHESFITSINRSGFWQSTMQCERR